MPHEKILVAEDEGRSSGGWTGEALGSDPVFGLQSRSSWVDYAYGTAPAN